MKRAIAGVLTLMVLTGCGVDGEPVPPTRDAVSLLGPVPVEVTALEVTAPEETAPGD